MKMPKKLKAKWLKALRSGEYGQAKETLCDGKGNFCCLGVLEHIVLKGEVEVTPKGEYDEFPNNEFWDYAGIEVDIYNDVPQELAELNDSGTTFKQLAKIIEKKVEVY